MENNPDITLTSHRCFVRPQSRKIATIPLKLQMMKHRNRERERKD